MPISKLSILGYRGFAEEQVFRPSVPNGTPGSGLTLLVGPNNAGKSTVMEALRFFANNDPPSFSEGRRNKAAGDAVKIKVEESGGHSHVLRSIAGGSEAEFAKEPATALPILPVHALTSRRFFNAFFSGYGQWNRQQFHFSSRGASAGIRSTNLARGSRVL